jgi:hypothetical protein
MPEILGTCQILLGASIIISQTGKGLFARPGRERRPSTLALLVLGVLADDPHLSETADYFTFHTHFFH